MEERQLLSLYFLLSFFLESVSLSCYHYRCSYTCNTFLYKHFLAPKYFKHIHIWDSTHLRYPFIHIAHHQECPSIFQILHYSIIYNCSLVSSHVLFHSHYQHSHQFHWKCIPSIATKSISQGRITRNTPTIFAPPSARRNFFKCASLA